MADFVQVGEFFSVGLSTDTKLTSVPAGHNALELDTGDVYCSKDGGTTYYNITQKTTEKISGVTYRNADTAAADTARRCEVTTKKLRGATILVSGKAQLFGDDTTQDYPVNPGDTLSYDCIDISTLYFKNAAAGENGTVYILGVEE